MKCTNCGKEIIGEPVAPGRESELVYFDGDHEEVIAPARLWGFCSEHCAWSFGIKHHREWGMIGKEAREHLIKEHGLKPA